MGKSGQKQQAQTTLLQHDDVVITTSKDVTSGAYGNLSRSISDKDLKNPAIGRVLLDSIDQLKVERNELIEFRGNYYRKVTDCAVLESKVLGESKFQKLYSAAQTLGGVIFGTSFNVISNIPVFLTLFISGLLLIGFALVLAGQTNNESIKK